MTRGLASMVEARASSLRGRSVRLTAISLVQLLSGPECGADAAKPAGIGDGGHKLDRGPGAEPSEAWMIGTSMPKRSQSGVRSMVFTPRVSRYGCPSKRRRVG